MAKNTRINRVFFLYKSPFHLKNFAKGCESLSLMAEVHY